MAADYVLVTPARNEGAFIGRTIEAVLAQTVPPRKWVIVSDGSTDATDEIVAGFAKRHSTITLLRAGVIGERSFSSKVGAFRAGEKALQDVAFDFIGNLDADVTFPPHYFERILSRFGTLPRLGVAGGLIHELINGRFVEQRTSFDSVAGAVQLFRKECYDAIGGYTPLRFGGVDSAAEITARMHGWDVRTFQDLEVHHHRRVSSGEAGLIKTKLRHGRRHYALGCHPAFEVMRCIYRVSDRPWILGSVLTVIGYMWAWAVRQERELPANIIAYVRGEQRERLCRLLSGRSVCAGEARERSR